MTVLFATMFKLILMDFVNGFSVVGKAFAVATVIVFGGASLIFGFTASKLEIQNVSIVLCALIIFFKIMNFLLKLARSNLFLSLFC